MEYLILFLILLCTVVIFYSYHQSNNFQKQVEKTVKEVLEELKQNSSTKQVNEANVKLLKENFAYKIKHKEYREFFEIVLTSIQEDTDFIRSNFFNKFGSMTDYAEINSQIQNFQIRLNAIVDAIKEYKILNEPKD